MLKQRLPILIGLACAMGVAAFFGCAKKPEPRLPSPEPTASPQGGPQSLSLGAGVSLLEITSQPGADNALTEAKADGLKPSASTVPWQESNNVAGIEALEGAVYAVINRYGLIEIRQKGDSATYDTLPDPHFQGRTALSVFSERGKLYAFLAPEDPFDDKSDAAVLLSFSPETRAFTEEKLAFRQSYGDEWKILYCAPMDLSDSFALLVQLNHKEGKNIEEGYLRLDPETGSFIPLKRSAYLKALDPRRGKPAEPLGLLVDAPKAISRYLNPQDEKATPYSVVLQSRGSAWAAKRGYLLKGDGSEEWSAEIYGWQGNAEAIALNPDGSFRYARLRAGGAWSQEAGNFPGLPPTFDYSYAVISGGLAIGAWAETIFPNVGQSGLAIARLSK
jgi:hypothetical protein